MRDHEGAVFAEYVVVLVLVGLLCCLATFALGVPLLQLYRFAQMVLAVPFP